MGTTSSSVPKAAAFSLPGRQNAGVRSAMPAVARETRACGPTSATERARNRSPNPGNSRSNNSSTASTVTSSGVTPVPPVVTTASTASSSQNPSTRRRMARRSSATRSRWTTVWPPLSTASTTASPLASVSSVRLDETVSTAKPTASASW
jgi:hypothetical protein